MTSTSGISKLLSECEAIGTHDPDYYAKMLHPIPDCLVVDRVQFILDRVKDKVVLDIGGTGPMHTSICEIAKEVFTFDVTGTVSANHFVIDLDWEEVLPALNPDIIVCGEVIEHLGNPLFFLRNLLASYPGVPVLVTVPNAFGYSGMRQVEHSARENVNLEHVAYYSYWTLKRLLTKAGFVISEFYWYGGPPRLSEGMIALVMGDRNGNF